MKAYVNSGERMKTARWLRLITSNIMANEEAKSLIGMVLIFSLLFSFNLYLYIEKGFILRLTIPLGLATLFLFFFRNTVISFLSALVICTIIFREIPGSAFFSIIKNQLGYTVLTILVIGGFLQVLTVGEGGKQLNIFARKLSRSLLRRKIAGIVITSFNCFSSPATVSAMHLLFREDLENKRIPEDERNDLIRIMLMFSNISCALIPFSLWWLYFTGFSSPDIDIRFSHLLPFLSYPIVVLLYWFSFRLWRRGKKKKPREGQEEYKTREIIIEHRKFELREFLLLFVVPMTITFGIILYYGFSKSTTNSLFNSQTFVLGAFAVGSLVTLFIHILFHINQLHFPLAITHEISSMIDRSRKNIDNVSEQLASSNRPNAKMGFVIKPETDILKNISQRIKLSSMEKKLLGSVIVYKRYDNSRVINQIFVALGNVADTTGAYYNDFMNGAKGMIGTATVLIASWALRDLISTKGMYLYPNLQECTVLLNTLSIEYMPIALFIVATFIGLVIGTSWGTFAVMYSFVLIIRTMFGDNPLSPEQYYLINALLGAIISSSVFINQSSKQADNVVVTSQLTGRPPEEVLRMSRTDRWICYGLSCIPFILFCFLY